MKAKSQLPSEENRKFPSYLGAGKKTDRTYTRSIGPFYIGEAVPPLLAKAIAENIAVHLDEHRRNNL
jgi:site-specific DNA-cytosine methylase